MHWLIRKKLLLEEKKHSYKLQHKLAKLSIFSRYNKKRYSCKICKLSTLFVNFVTLLKKKLCRLISVNLVIHLLFVFLLWRWERGDAVISTSPINTSLISLSRCICYIVDKEPRNIRKEVVWLEQKIGQQIYVCIWYGHEVWYRLIAVRADLNPYARHMFLYLNILATLSILKLLYCLKL